MSTVPVVKLAELFDKKYAISAEDGDKLYNILKSSLDEKKEVIISFEGIELIITAFLNISYGRLFKDYSLKDIETFIKIEHLPEEKEALLNLVKERAISFYKK